MLYVKSDHTVGHTLVLSFLDKMNHGYCVAHSKHKAPLNLSAALCSHMFTQGSRVDFTKGWSLLLTFASALQLLTANKRM